MRDIVVYQEYSKDKEYGFEVYPHDDYYQVWVQKKITDEYMGED